ncbi:hypothetical protein [Arsenicibacter rosenii]|nr:hypothetical protein [Arsenicibacter rosenii]
MASSDQPTAQQQLEQLQRQLIILKQKKEVIDKGIADTEAAIARLEKMQK